MVEYSRHQPEDEVLLFGRQAPGLFTVPTRLFVSLNKPKMGGFLSYIVWWCLVAALKVMRPELAYRPTRGLNVNYENSILVPLCE